MSLKDTMKLRVTISRQIRISGSAEATDQSEKHSGSAARIHIREAKNITIEQWQEKLERRIKDAEDFFLYDKD